LSALNETQFEQPPKRTQTGKAVDNYWLRETAIYLLFVLQKTRFLSLRPLNLDNILYQCGFDNLKLVELFRVSEADAFASLPFWIVIPTSLPFWIVIPKMTGSQLSSFIRRNRIIIPDNCSKSRDSLSKLVLESYTKWDDVLCDEETTVNEIIEAFDCIDD